MICCLSSATRRFGEYELHDLVALDGPQTVGVLVNVGKDTARVLTNQVAIPQPVHMRCQVASG